MRLLVSCFDAHAQRASHESQRILSDVYGNRAGAKVGKRGAAAGKRARASRQARAAAEAREAEEALAELKSAHARKSGGKAGASFSLRWLDL